MKRLCLIIALMFLSSNFCSAAIMKVVSLSNFTTLDEATNVKLYVAQDCFLHNNLLIPEGSVLAGAVTDIKAPRRLKRNADFDFMVCYYMDSSHNKYKIELPLCGNYTKAPDIDEKQMAKSAAISASGKAVPGLSYAIYAAEGAKQHRGHRVKGAFKNIYDHSFLSWGKRGEHLRIQKGDCFCLTFPQYDDEEYTYQNLLSPIDKYGNPIKKHEIDRFLNQNDTEGGNLEPNYPIKHQFHSRVYYISKPKKNEQ